MIVNLNAQSKYQLHFQNALFERASELLAQVLHELGHTKSQRCAFFIDDGFLSHWPHLLGQIRSYFDSHNLGEPLLFPYEGGEACKTLEHAQTIWSIMHEAGLDRHDAIVALGGGAFLDLIGFCASSYHRGMKLIRMPTTVLSQNDSGVGVKNGINYFGQKNSIGFFGVPHAVLCDSQFLKSLPPRDLLAGQAEAIKVSLIKDAAFFAWQEENISALANFETDAMEESIKRSAILHADHIAEGGDTFEQGSKRPLDYGHWSAHKIECLSDYSIRHGEAVASGMLLDSLYSHMLGMLDAESLDRIFNLILGLGFAPSFEELYIKNASKYKGVGENSQNYYAVLDGIEEFRIHIGGELDIPMISRIGSVTGISKVDEKIMIKCLLWLQEFARCLENDKLYQRSDRIEISDRLATFSP